ncbi:hypothetical protein FOH10_14375 [Nocardia otitidiscaviarum]|uniref:Uncharacterized protein n=1 Tax=Nocardia otitidiscaviarum TaxID=1823 RepID=A0A516NLC7_9NOCA|nr:hypothetical protein [Nocardia otitidiscaviarum]MCP9619253.1 hypothetical protein [Nocardia otitidiscaviarum]QDP79721.1 hypothetical protein FOH10_14375 [Nocardia otitidiscaviarum]
MSYYGIPGYRPRWLVGLADITSAHGQRLSRLVGRPLSKSWLVWDQSDDEWFADCPVVLDFDGEQVEITHQKFDELSITWNSIAPHQQRPWSYPEDNDPEIDAFHLSWRSDAITALTALEGQPLLAVDLLEWTSQRIDFATGMIAVSFTFTSDRLTISNGLDENRLELGAPPVGYLHYPLRD